MPTAREAKILTVAGREVAISHPDKVLFPKPRHTKLDLAQYYIAVAEGALRGAGGRPNMLVRYPDGIEGEKVVGDRIRLAKGDDNAEQSDHGQANTDHASRDGENVNGDVLFQAQG